MAIHLFHGPPQDHWLSMDVYAANLTAALQAQAHADIRSFAFARPLASIGGKIGRYLSLVWRMLPYPVMARARAGSLNHILDHSYAHLAYSLPPGRTVVTCHDLAPWAMAGSRAGLSYAVWRLALGGLTRASRVLADSESTAADLRRFPGFSQVRVRVVPLGVNQSFRPTSSDLRQRLDLPDGPLILHIGGNHPRKNIGLIVRALPYLPADFTFVQVGGGLTPTTQVKPLNFVSGSELAALYSLADVFVFPSKYEGFGLPPLEAMACGTPVIAANTSSLPEVVGDAGLLVSPDDPEELAAAIRRVLTEPDLAAVLRERGLARARQYTWERTARETLAVYEEVLAEAKEH